MIRTRHRGRKSCKTAYLTSADDSILLSGDGRSAELISAANEAALRELQRLWSITASRGPGDTIVVVSSEEVLKSAEEGEKRVNVADVLNTEHRAVIRNLIKLPWIAEWQRTGP